MVGEPAKVQPPGQRGATSGQRCEDGLRVESGAGGAHVRAGGWVPLGEVDVVTSETERVLDELGERRRHAADDGEDEHPGTEHVGRRG